MNWNASTIESLRRVFPKPKGGSGFPARVFAIVP
jgi:kynurenine formamidase